jgi:acyl carrier protein
LKSPIARSFLKKDVRLDLIDHGNKNKTMDTKGNMIMDRDAIRAKLLEFITATFFVDEDEIDLDNSLVDDGIIDSFGLVEIASFLKTAFSITVEGDDMTRENFGSVNKMVTFIIGRKS